MDSLDLVLTRFSSAPSITLTAVAKDLLSCSFSISCVLGCEALCKARCYFVRFGASSHETSVVDT